jgi:uncharacterized protein (DUF952 family)
MAEPVYKVLSETAFKEAERKGRFTGSADDSRDGFIHLSTAHQLDGTLAAHFTGQAGLILLAVDPSRFGPALKWERSRGGELFPHLYTPLDLGAVLWTKKLTLGEDGRHVLPEGVLA